MTFSLPSSSEEPPPKRRRGRFRKQVQQAKITAIPESDTPLPSMFLGIGSAKNLNELRDAFEALGRVARHSTALAYRQPLARWKYPYTVGPSELVMASFTEFVFERTSKNMSQLAQMLGPKYI
ncbi:hypothetical protein G6F42_024198 [Rhizopus arrhizus]|nr:hypothetical protein G6F42_024198 [Rhizopus arrhizus]